MADYVDVEVLLVAYLKAKTGKRVVTELPANLDSLLPVVQVARVAGADSDYRLDRPLVAVDAWAATRAAAVALANEVRSYLRNDLPRGDAVQPTGVVTSVTTVTGPRWMPDPNPNLRRYGATYQLITHP